MSPKLPLLVTGAAGFIGSRFVRACQARGQPVINVDTLEFFENRPEHYGIEFGTRIDRDAALEWLTRERPPLSGIVHLGACSDTMESDAAFLKRVNVEYSKSLWEYAAQAGLTFVFASSAATYGDGDLGYADDEAQLGQLRPLNLYGQSKQDFDLWALAQTTTPPTWSGFKFFNVYGPGERHKGRMASVILHAFDQIQASGEVTLFKSHREGIQDGEQRRDFVYVDDVVDVLFFALERPLARGIYNLGSGRARTFLDLARGVFATLGLPERIRFVDTPLAIRDKYQYFTEAPMGKLTGVGYGRDFTSLENGIHAYLPLLSAKR